MNKIKSEWERTRLQTWHLINIQLDKKEQVSYDKFKSRYWPFTWEEPEIKEIPVINWEEKDKREEERKSKFLRSEILHL